MWSAASIVQAGASPKCFATTGFIKREAFGSHYWQLRLSRVDSACLTCTRPPACALFPHSAGCPPMVPCPLCLVTRCALTPMTCPTMSVESGVVGVANLSARSYCSVFFRFFVLVVPAPRRAQLVVLRRCVALARRTFARLHVASDYHRWRGPAARCFEGPPQSVTHVVGVSVVPRLIYRSRRRIAGNCTISSKRERTTTGREGHPRHRLHAMCTCICSQHANCSVLPHHVRARGRAGLLVRHGVERAVSSHTCSFVSCRGGLLIARGAA